MPPSRVLLYSVFIRAALCRNYAPRGDTLLCSPHRWSTCATFGPARVVVGDAGA